MSPGLIAMYAALAWLALSAPAGLLIGRAINYADRMAAGTCYCGGCPR